MAGMQIQYVLSEIFLGEIVEGAKLRAIGIQDASLPIALIVSPCL